MILVLTVIMVTGLIIGVVIYKNAKYGTNEETTGVVLCAIFGILTAACVIATITLSVLVSQARVLDDQIAMYEEENNKIETQIAEAVKQYQEYEHDIFIEVNPESAVTLVSLYPELKSDTLVQKQIEVYAANNEKIKELKAAKINSSVEKWWLYFGG